MIEVPALRDDGLTQARRLGEAELMARELIAVSTGKPLADISVTAHIKLNPEGSDLAERAHQISQERERAAQAEAAAVESARELAHEMAAASVPVRDIGQLLNVSFQRASQLVNS
ncbi:hypothetical protein B2J88_29530 [Rhodococcus sp. SRB_17]|nr:hypothetical protein [Rhodococcus sp. SRB_17]